MPSYADYRYDAALRLIFAATDYAAALSNVAMLLLHAFRDADAIVTLLPLRHCAAILRYIFSRHFRHFTLTGDAACALSRH